jgi:cell volume regulation protein A
MSPLNEVTQFAEIVLVAAGVFTLAVFSSRLSQRIRLPSAVLFLIAAALASDLVPAFSRVLTIREVERLVSVALILILFDGGMHVGWRRFARAAAPILSLGVLGTFATAGLVTAAAHYVLGFAWATAALIGTALAPTDPAVVFSVLGKREVVGRSGTILEGESGANDPVGIALMIGVLELVGSDAGSPAAVVADFCVQMAVGLAVGAAGAWVLIRLMRRVPLPGEGLYPLRTLGMAGVIFGAAVLLHGSGFLAVFVAGVLVGDGNAPYKSEIERFHAALASLAEIVAFIALGFTIDLSSLAAQGYWWKGLVLAVLLGAARLLVAGPLLLPVRLRWGERLFVMSSGLKGAVPILLGTFVVLAGVAQARLVYQTIFVVVAFSVMVQGSALPWIARRLGVPMRDIEPEPWDVSIRLRHEPRGISRYVVARGAEADGAAIRDLPFGEEAWVSLVVRDGAPLQVRGETELEAGDEVLVLAEAESEDLLKQLFEGPARRGDLSEGG